MSKVKIFPGDIVKYKGVRCLVTDRRPCDDSVFISLEQTDKTETPVDTCCLITESDVTLIGRGETLIFRIKRIFWKELKNLDLSEEKKNEILEKPLGKIIEEIEFYQKHGYVR